jgi:hypothetical protein
VWLRPSLSDLRAVQSELWSSKLLRTCVMPSLIMMGWDCVSEPRSPTGLLFIPRVICQHGKPRWWWCLLGITPDSSARTLWQSYQQRHLGPVGGKEEEWEFLPISTWNTSRDLLRALKSYDMGPPALLPIRRKACCGLLSPLKMHRLGWIWTRDPWVQWQAH